MSPTQSNGRERASSHTGLNPLFFITPVRAVTVFAHEDVTVDVGGARVGSNSEIGGGSTIVVVLRIVGESGVMSPGCP